MQVCSQIFAWQILPPSLLKSRYLILVNPIYFSFIVSAFCILLKGLSLLNCLHCFCLGFHCSMWIPLWRSECLLTSLGFPSLSHRQGTVSGQRLKQSWGHCPVCCLLSSVCFLYFSVFWLFVAEDLNPFLYPGTQILHKCLSRGQVFVSTSGQSILVCLDGGNLWGPWRSSGPSTSFY
jgi:hypothetical protein